MRFPWPLFKYGRAAVLVGAFCSIEHLCLVLPGRCYGPTGCHLPNLIGRRAIVANSASQLQSILNGSVQRTCSFVGAKEVVYRLFEVMAAESKRGTSPTEFGAGARMSRISERR